MANITKEERERRAAAAAALTETTVPAESDETQETGVLTPEEPTVVERPPVTTAPPPPKKNPLVPEEQQAYEPTARDMRHIILAEMDTEKQRSIDCITQAETNAAAIAINEVRNSREYKDLKKDPADIRLRVAFLNRFGPTNVKPPCPVPGPHGFKDPKVLQWKATYDPKGFVEQFRGSRAPLIVKLLREAEARLSA
jgi:hypothetical protein